jgi:hypothetical protein
MSNQGGFSEEAFEKYQRLLSEQENVEFSEGETYDFTRCMRPDGTYYGTRGKCKKGSEAGAKEKEAGKPKAGSMLTASDSKRRQMVAAAKARQQQRDSGAPVKEGAAKRKLATSKETRAAWQEAEKAVKAAKAEYALVKAAVGRDKSPESQRRLINAGIALDKAERAALKASDKFFAASKRESAKAMTPEQRKLEREANKLTKGG